MPDFVRLFFASSFKDASAATMAIDELENYSLGGNLDGGMRYDKNGNIKSLHRYGYLSKGNYGQVDVLSYAYNNSNRLEAVSDGGIAGTMMADFKDGQTLSTEYSYDEAGNLEKAKISVFASIEALHFLPHPGPLPGYGSFSGEGCETVKPPESHLYSSIAD